MLSESQEDLIKLFNDYSSIVLEVKYETKYGKGFKILAPQQMLQILPIPPAQVKADNTSEKLLNEVRQNILCKELKRLLNKCIII